MFRVASPTADDDWNAYYELRWKMLRAPLGLPRGSERDECESSAQHLMVLDDQHQLVGVGRLHAIEPLIMQIRYMAVDPRFQRRGIGRLIVETLEKQARIQKAQRIVLNARCDAMEFYQALGFTITGPGPLLAGQVPHVRMEKDLSPGHSTI